MRQPASGFSPPLGLSVAGRASELVRHRHGGSSRAGPLQGTLPSHGTQLQERGAAALNGVVEAPTGRGSRLNEAISWSRGNTQHDAAPARIPVTLLERAPQRHNAPRPTVAVINERHLAPASDVTTTAVHRDVAARSPDTVRDPPLSREAGVSAHNNSAKKSPTIRLRTFASDASSTRRPTEDGSEDSDADAETKCSTGEMETTSTDALNLTSMSKVCVFVASVWLDCGRMNTRPLDRGSRMSSNSGSSMPLLATTLKLRRDVYSTERQLHG